MRKSGILMHISSLPGAGGIGSLGKEAYAFAEYTGRVYAPTFAECLFGSTGEWPEGKGYADWQKAKLPRMRLGVPDGSELAAEIDAILKEGTEG